jgi:hypothetical protein
LCYSCAFFFHFYCPLPLNCRHWVSNASLLFFFFVTLSNFLSCFFWCLTSFCPIWFGSKNLIPRDLCYPECSTAPLQLGSKRKAEGDDHYYMLCLVKMLICCEFQTVAFGSKYEKLTWHLWS